MEYTLGSFGILNLDGMENPPFILLDGGIERRYQEVYDYTNSSRDDYHGYLFQYTLNGKGCFETKGIQYDLKEGMGFLVQFPEDSRYCLPPDSTVPWEFIFLHFDGYAAPSFWEKFVQISENPFCLDRNSPPVRMALGLHAKMMEIGRLEKYQGGEFLYRFMCGILRELEYPAQKDKDTLVSTALRLMDEEYGTLQSIEELAVRLGVSFSHFTRCFRQETGIPPIQYLTQLRVQSAMNDLLNTDQNLESISRRNGFSNGNYFAKVFRRKVGLAPGEYRRKHRI